MKDAELRRSAFQIVLEDLLAGGSRAKSSLRGKGKSAQNGHAQEDPVRMKKQPDKASRGGTQSCVDELLSDGFFKEQKNISEVEAELKNRGHHIPVTSLSGPLQRMCKERKLRRQKMAKIGNRRTWSYSVW
jgi:hypothetical protein